MTSPSPEKRKNTFVSDEPSLSDYLDYEPYVKALVRLITGRETQTPLTLGISGSWGSGKTTLMYLMEKEVESLSNREKEKKDQHKEAELALKCLRINVWEISQDGEGGQALLQALFTKVRNSLSLFHRISFGWHLLRDRVNINALLRQIAVNSYRILIVIAPLVAAKLFKAPNFGATGVDDKGLPAGISVLLGVWLILKPMIEAAREKVSLDLGVVLNDAPYESRVSALQKLQTHFERLVGDWVGKDGRLVVFIDDLDRCSPDRIAGALEALKLVATTKGCVYVLGIDQDVVARSVQARYKDITGEMPLEGVRYLEKIIQLPFQLPQIEVTDIRGYVNSFNMDWPHSGCADIFIEGLPPNPRQLKRAINLFFLIWQLAESRREKLGSTVTALRLAKIVALQTAYPDLFEEFKAKPYLLKKLENYYWRGREEQKSLEENPEESKRLTATSKRQGLERLFDLHRDDPLARFGELELTDLAAFFSLTRSVTLTRVDPGTAESIKIVDPTVAGSTSLHQLPAPVGDFVGREQEIGTLINALRGGRPACISGMGGIGKTELALLVARSMSAQYPEAQFFINLQGNDANPRRPEDALANCIRAFLGLEARLPDDVEQLTQLYRSQLGDKRVLILLDNAAGRAQVLPLLPPPGCSLLITSRHALSLPGMVALTLDLMPAPQARQLLLEIVPRADNVADQICQLCGYLPLAIRAAGSLLATTADLDPADYATQLRDERGRLELIGAEGVEIGVEASLNLSYASLNSDAARVFRQLAVFPATFDATAEEVVCADPGHTHLSDLIRRSLVLYDTTTKRYRPHHLARLFADSRLSAAERFAAQRLHTAHYKGVLAEADSLYLEGDEAIVRGLELVDLEWGNIQTGQEWATAQAETDDEAAQLCIAYPDAGVYVLLLRQHPREQIIWLEASLAAARRLKQKGSEGNVLGNLGWAYAALGETSRAIEFHEQYLTVAREIGDRRAEGEALGNLGQAYAALGETRRAIEFHEQYLTMAREISDRRGEGNALGNLGQAYAALGETRRAIEFHEQYLTIAREIGDRRAEGIALGNLGRAYAALGETRRAIEFHEQYLTVAREIGDRRGEGNALGNLGLAYAAMGETRRAIEFYEQYLAIARKIGDRRGEGNALGNLGIAYNNLGESRRAIEFHEQALSIDYEIGDRRGIGADLGNLGNAYAALGETRRAIEFHEQRLDIARETGDRRGEGNALGNLGLAYAALGETRKAMKFYEQRLDIAREIGDRRGEGNVLGNLGAAYAKLGETSRAVEFYEQRLVIAREIGDRRGEGNALYNMSLSLHKLGQRTQAIEQAEGALKIRDQIEDPNAERVRRRLARWHEETRSE